MLNHRSIAGVSLLLVALYVGANPAAVLGDEYYTEEKVYNLRPNPKRGMAFGHIGPTGIHVYLNEGMVLTVEQVAAGTPAEGKFRKGDVITGVNGEKLHGRNPFVVLGKAITEAEATDGKLVFDVRRGEASRTESLAIPVLGRYSATWPVDCEKSKRIVEQAAAYYHQRLADDSRAVEGIPGVKDEVQGIPGALMCLFLLSTGDDQHLPVIKDYFKPFIANPKGIGDHTWNNGYQGIACAEYYLRTGDKDVLPVLQAYCDDAKRRQKFDAAWGHWGHQINPRYVAGGLMNAASVQVLTTMLLAKECGVDVDEQTLNNSLRFFYRFVGHGTVCYGDHRGEGGLGSNGKDGMLAAAMQVASHATGDTSIYRSARDYLSMSTLNSYPNLATGHGDNGRGDGIWRGLSAAYLIDKKPADYRDMMDRLTWWYDLSRYHNGAVGMAAVPGFNDPGSGAAVAMSYTAHLKTLRITGAPRSKHAVDFTLPQHLWGRPADRVFHGNDHLPEFSEYGKEIAPHKLLAMLGHAYRSVSPDHPRVTREQLIQNLYHHRYMFRSQAAIALRKSGEIGELEKALKHSDPRVRRAALDGIYDWRYWHGMGRDPLEPEQFTPGMIRAITMMISDPDEAVYVVEGALFAMHHMPAEAIAPHVDAIRKWTTHEDWWLRESSFMALQGLAKNDKLYMSVLPRLVDMMVDEYHTMPRQRMSRTMTQTLRSKGENSAAGRIILAGLERAAGTSEIIPGDRAREGSYNVINAVHAALRLDADAAVTLAGVLAQRFDVLDTGRLLQAVDRQGSGRSGFYPVLAELKGEQKKALTDILTSVYLPELTRRLKATPGVNLELIDTVLALKELAGETGGWQVVGSPAPADRVWRYTTIDPPTEAQTRPKRERKRFRDITLPDRLAGWFKPEFDDRAWRFGEAPIGVGEFRQRDKHFKNRSPWGEGEFLLGRTTFEVESLEFDLYRIRVLANQGFHIYLNGQKIQTYIWWRDDPHYRKIPLNDGHTRHLKKGTNTLAVYANVEYPSAMKPHWKQAVQGQIDVYLEGLRQSDMYAD